MTPWWFENNLLTRCVSCSVRSPVSRPSPKLASSRLRQRLFGAAASQTSRRKPCYRQSDLFSNSSWLYYFTHHVLQCSSSAHCQKLLTGRGFLSGTVLQAKLQNTKKQRHCNGSKFPSLCLCLFCFVHKKVDAEGFGFKTCLRTLAVWKAVSCQRVKYDMKCF